MALVACWEFSAVSGLIVLAVVFLPVNYQYECRATAALSETRYGDKYLRAVISVLLLSLGMVVAPRQLRCIHYRPERCLSRFSIGVPIKPSLSERSASPALQEGQKRGLCGSDCWCVNGGCNDYYSRNSVLQAVRKIG
jgi:hypothetical protein